MPTCPYCAKECSALKNHVRLASGDGHGPAGSYPEDFEGGGGSDPPPAQQQASDGGGTALDTVDDDALVFSPEEYDQVVSGVRAEGYNEGVEDGFDAGYGTAQHELQDDDQEDDVIDVESTAVDSDPGDSTATDGGAASGTASASSGGGILLKLLGAVVAVVLFLVGLIAMAASQNQGDGGVGGPVAGGTTFTIDGDGFDNNQIY